MNSPRGEFADVANLLRSLSNLLRSNVDIMLRVARGRRGFAHDGGTVRFLPVFHGVDRLPPVPHCVRTAGKRGEAPRSRGRLTLARSEGREEGDLLT